jgi:O-antigen/teichoic acid export membrane protein
MSGLKKVVVNSFLYTFSTLLLRASSIFLFPIFSSYLVEKDYGIISVTQSLISFVVTIAGLGITNALTREMHFNKNNIPKDELLLNSLFVSFISNTLFAVLILLVGDVLFKPLLNDVPAYPYLYLAAITLPFSGIVDVFRNYYKAIQKGRNAFALDLSYFSIIIVFNLIFVVLFKYKATAIFYSNLLVSAIYALVLLGLFYKLFVHRIKFTIIKNMLRYSLPLIPFFIFNILFDSVDKLMLNHYHGSVESGLYYLAITFASIFSSLKEGILTAITPFAFSSIEQKNKLAHTFNLIFLVSSVLAFSLSLFAKEIISVLSSNNDFIASSKFVPYITVSLIVVFLGQLINIKTLYFGKYNKYLFIATIIGIVADFIACYFLIPNFEIQGAVISRLIGFVVQTFVFVYFSLKEERGKDVYNFKYLIFIMILSSSFIIASSYIDVFNLSLLHAILLKLGIVVCIGIVLIPFYPKFVQLIKSIRNV